MNLPNKLTMIRILLTPVLMITFYCRLYTLSAVFFVLAALTDLLDGRLARQKNLVTTFGKFFDPLADKLINLTALVLLVSRVTETQAAWYAGLLTVSVCVIVIREITVTSLRALAASEGIVIAADRLGKLKTVVQDVAIVLMLLDESAVSAVPFAGQILHWTAVVTLVAALMLTILSGVHYFTANKELIGKIMKDI
ncbi:MAG: CDP-diacylglycerol--glycerol-3-phosphate 3-phosphatidyltransferase [Clostridia bacterium]|nr:CDP-diacylglycerol--glycerol-3-phosphate 3-phosphatidyltransferase [Clostridia bacterium]